MATLQDLEIGQHVNVYDEHETIVSGTVVVIQDVAGKKIGVQMDRHHPKGHSLDGACAEGYGVWTLPERVAIL